MTLVFLSSHPDFDFILSLGYLLTGHGYLNAFLHARGLSSNETCLCGSSSENAIHVLCECPLYSDLRDLNRMGIVRCVNGDRDVSRALDSLDQVQYMRDFAVGVFSRHRVLVVN